MAQVMVIAKQGGVPRAFTRGETVSEFHWAPDGRSIAYLARESPGAGGASISDGIVADDVRELARLWVIDVGLMRVAPRHGRSLAPGSICLGWDAGHVMADRDRSSSGRCV